MVVISAEDTWAEQWDGDYQPEVCRKHWEVQTSEKFTDKDLQWPLNCCLWRIWGWQHSQSPCEWHNVPCPIKTSLLLRFHPTSLFIYIMPLIIFGNICSSPWLFGPNLSVHGVCWSQGLCAVFSTQEYHQFFTSPWHSQDVPNTRDKWINNPLWKK